MVIVVLSSIDRHFRIHHYHYLLPFGTSLCSTTQTAWRIVIKIQKAITQAQLGYAINFWNPKETQFRKMLQARAYGNAMQLQRGYSYDMIRNELHITIKTVRDEAWNKFQERGENIEEKKHPTKEKIQEIKGKEKIAAGRLKKLPTLEWEVKQAERRNEVKEEKINTFIPQYLYRENSCAWLTARIKFKQGCGDPSLPQHNGTTKGLQVLEV